MLDPHRLRLLLELSRRGSMRAVADELGYTTSTVSQQLAVLAREAGATLIEPDGRRVRLTPAGHRLADHAVTILAALEAAACALPVLVGDSGGTPETVQHGRTGYLIDPRDPSALAARIRSLLHDRELAADLGRRGRGFVAGQFGFPAARRELRAALRLDRPGLERVPIRWPGA